MCEFKEMSRLLIGFLVLILLAACSTDKKPPGIVERKNMVSLLSDFHLAEGYISSLPQDSARLMANNYYAAVFSKHGTDSVGFNKSLIYYSKDPTVLNQIYTEVQQRLQRMQTDEQAIVDAKMRKIYLADSVKSAFVRDSLNKIKTDSINYKLTKNLVYWKNKDSIKLKPAPWSLKLHEALVKRTFKTNGNIDQLKSLLFPADSLKNVKQVDSLKKNEEKLKK